MERRRAEDGDAGEGPGVGTLLRWVAPRALALRCPQCGRGRLMRGFGELEPACPECGLVYRREPGAMTGSMYLTAAVNQVFACLVITLVWIFTDWSVLVSLLVSVPLVGAFCFAFLPWSQSLWVAIEYVSDYVDREPWVAPRPPGRRGEG